MSEYKQVDPTPKSDDLAALNEVRSGTENYRANAYGILVGKDGLIVDGPDGEQWDCSEEDGISAIVSRLNDLAVALRKYGDHSLKCSCWVIVAGGAMREDGLRLCSCGFREVAKKAATS